MFRNVRLGALALFTTALTLSISAQSRKDETVTTPPRTQTTEQTSQAAPPAVTLEQMLRRDTTGLFLVKRTNGTSGYIISDRYMHAALARVDADGKLVTNCTDDLRTAIAFLQNQIRLQNAEER